MVEQVSDHVFVGEISRFPGKYPLTVYSGVSVLCDENTHQYCLPRLQKHLDLKANIITIPSGEQSKHLNTCQHIWQNLVEVNADRNHLLINLGGGVVTDIGGFCASTYMRGIPFINISTSLLGQVDASVGHKTGVDFLELKNMIGTFANPVCTWIDPGFLATLAYRHTMNGKVEMLKHALIADGNHWNELTKDLELRQIPPQSTITHSVTIKQNIVDSDPFEKKQRKALNFGHTIGHALESYALSQSIDILHGEAVAFGMMVAGQLSNDLGFTSASFIEEMNHHIAAYCTFTPDKTVVDNLIKLALSDKKNQSGKFRFTLLRSIGDVAVNVNVTHDELKTALLKTIDCVKTLKN